MTFDNVPGAPISADRRYLIFNQNGWARSLHFLAAWLVVCAGLIYLVAGFVSGHLWRNIVPRENQLSPSALWQDLKESLRNRIHGAGPPYGRVQRVSYFLVVLVLAPLMVLTGLTMSPAITATYPLLLDIFGGYQSARSVHFLAFAALLLFFVVHLAIVFATGFKRQMKAMTWGK